MSGQRLFVINEAGSAAFCMPLWKKWIETPPPFEWSVIASPSAQTLIEKHIGARLPQVHSWGDLIDLSGIERVIASATADPYEAEFSGRGVPFIQFLDAPYNLEQRVASPHPDTLLIIHENVAQAARDLGISAEIIGHPIWEESAAKTYDARPKEQFVFIAQPISQIPELDDLGYNENTVWDLLCAAQDACPDQIEELIYCPHPAQKSLPDNLAHNRRFLDENENPLEAGGTFVSMFSALMVDAYLAGRRIISFQPGLRREDRCILSTLGFIPLVTSQNDEALFAALGAQQRQSFDFTESLRGSLKRFEQACL